MFYIEYMEVCVLCITYGVCITYLIGLCGICVGSYVILSFDICIQPYQKVL